ncbi:unnamed protein product [Arctia plantaginis]|uniref:Cyclic nucleotide-binding domain-containing protein n=1 Tax=Arctia plantaginis TaxID=874455 RepID=A0A8S0Z658_ARCPL|nr:unnamed protein product [Arctia plantaginis]
MGPKKKDEKELNPEQEMKRKFKAKCRFRALGRMVMANTYWLIEAAEQYEGVEDVKRRVAQAVRGKTKKKRLLSITDKALLNKPAAERTDLEKKYIFRIIGGLKCFKRYPNHVKKKLAAVTYFKYYGPDRVIVRQHQEAHALYFIVTGDVIVSHLVYDDLLQQNVSVDIGIMHAGDMFGEVSLLHNILRTATCTTAGHCELLILMKEDFKNVLQASVQRQWDEVKNAMSAFNYFDGLDEVARREGCIVAKMKSYGVNEIILGDGVGVANFVYFILSGRCQMIESLQVCATTRLGRTTYKLYDPYVEEEESEQDMDKKYFAAYKNLNKSDTTSSSKGSREQRSSVEGPQDNATEQASEEPKRRPSILKTTDKSETRESSASNVLRVTLASNSSEQKRANTKENEFSPLATVQEILPTTDAQRDSMRLSVELKITPPPPNLQTYFMQVCQFNPGSTFGFGENMRDRRIVALTKVDCMMLPKIWLLQRNTANIWTRIEHYLNKKIPTKKQLFKDFVTERRWLEFREQLVEDVLSRSNTVNWTSVHDVPYSIRMEEMIDI